MRMSSAYCLRTLGCVFRTQKIDKQRPLANFLGERSLFENGLLAITPTSASAASAAAITSITSSGRSLLLRAGNVHRERAPTEFFAMPHVDSGCAFCLARHLDKTETARAAGHAVGDDRCGDNRTRLRERIGKLLVRS
jgi:hypothetical protein